MKRLLATLTLLAVFAAPTLAHDWSGVVAKLYRSVGMLTDFTGDGFCSAFSIDNKRDYAMTAAHCVRPQYIAQGVLFDNTVVEVVYYNTDLDVAVIYVEDMDRPALKPREKLIKVGMEVGSLGFALEDGLQSHFRAGNVAGIGTVEDLDGIWIQIDQPVIGGMSGGPTVDTDGRVVLVNQMSDRAKTTLGRDIGSIWEATKEFWSYRP